jgi:hypothetical protein
MRGAFAIIGLTLLASGMASADPTRDEVMSGAMRCEGIADNRAWLDCFYGSAQPMRATLGLAPAPVTQTRLVPPPGASYGTTATARPPAPVRREKSGGLLADLLGSAKPTVTDMAMVSYRFSANHLFTVTLQNGQTYRQDEGDTVFAKWNRPADSYRVTVEPAADRFTLRVKGEPGLVFHVSRK